MECQGGFLVGQFTKSVGGGGLEPAENLWIPIFRQEAQVQLDLHGSDCSDLVATSPEKLSQKG